MTPRPHSRRRLLGGALGLLPVIGSSVTRRGIAGQDPRPVRPDGDIWEGLRRPLKLPTLATGAPCPRSKGRLAAPRLGFMLGTGPVFATLPFIGAVTRDLARPFPGSDGWYSVKVLWYVRPPESDQPLLIRGRRLDGPGEVRFAGERSAGIGIVADLKLAGLGGTAVSAPGWNIWNTYLVVRTPGCYAYQVDGADFSDVVVFEAVGARPEELTPLPPFGSLPHDLTVASGVQTRADMVRLALIGARLLAIQIDVAPSQTMPLELSSPGVRRLTTAAGPVLWAPDLKDGAPRVAVWDDGRRRYRLEVLAGYEPGAWSDAPLIALVEAFATAPEEAPTPPASG